MTKFFYKAYLKKKIGFLKVYILFVKFFRFFTTVSFLFKDIIFSLVKSFKKANTSYKILTLTLLGMVFFFSTVFLKNVYSQNIDTTNNINKQSSSEYIPKSQIESQYIDFAAMISDVVQGDKTSSGTNSTEQTGLLGMMTNLETTVYKNNPISAISYGKYYAQAHGLVGGGVFAASDTTPTGDGFHSLLPVYTLWELFRNIAYIGIAFMIVVLGFIIIMGGQYGQAEISVVNSIPKIIVALIAITFSFSIAGFVIDISNVMTHVIVNTLGPSFVDPGRYSPGEYPVGCNEKNPLTWPEYDGKDSGDLQGISPPTNADSGNKALKHCNYDKIENPDTKGGDFNIFRMMAPIIDYANWNSDAKSQNNILEIIRTPTDIAWLDGLLNSWVIQKVATISVDFIMNILILYWAIKIFILIFSSFIRIIMMAMFGPLILVTYPLTGGETLLKWLKNLLSPALVFPVVFAMMFVAAILAYGTTCTNSSNPTGQCVKIDTNLNRGPWYIEPKKDILNWGAGPALLTSTVNTNFIWNFVALGIVIAIPSIGKQLDTILQSEVSQHLAASGKEAGQYARGIASKIPIVGSVLGQVL